MRTLHRRTLAAALLAAPALLVHRARAQNSHGATDHAPGNSTATNGTTAGGAGTTVLRVGDQKGGAQSLITASGVLDRSDLRVEWSQFAAAAPLAEALNAGAIDVGGIGDAPFAFARAAGAPIHAVGATRSTGSSTALLVHADAPFRSFADLRGRTIGTGKGSVGHYLVLAAREKAGLKPGDIRIAFLSPSEAKAAFASGQIDAWSTWGQYVHLSAAEDRARILLDGQGLMSGLSFQVATESAIAAKPRELKQFIALWSEALRWGNSNLDRYAEAWARETGVSTAVARATLDARGFTPVPIDTSVIEAQQRTVDLYARERILRDRYDVRGSFDPAFSA